MRTRVYVLPTAIAALALAATTLMAQAPERPLPEERPRLTAEQQALVTEAKGLRKQIHIARLELALAEAKEAPEKEIAAKAEHLYRLRGRLHAMMVKHPELRALAGSPRAGWRQGRGCGLGMQGQGPGMGRGGKRWGMHGAGPGMGRGWQGGPGPGMGQGWRGDGPRPGVGARERARLRLHQPGGALEVELTDPTPLPADEPLVN